MDGDNVCKIFFALKCKTEEAASFESGKIISSFLTSAEKNGVLVLSLSLHWDFLRIGNVLPPPPQ